MSEQMFQEALKVMPGGVSSPVRGFGSVGGAPVFIKKAKGAYLWDVDDNKYIDYVGSWGPAILGHTHPEILSAVGDAASRGLTFGAPTEGETLLANKITSVFPGMDKIRFVSSGTEACMSAIRLARGFTGRNKIIKFKGNYHGHGDMLLVKAGSGVATFGLPDSPGVPSAVAQHTLVADYNDLPSVAQLFEQNSGEIAALIVEPIAGNSGFIRPIDGFLQGLRDLCSLHGSLLIFDEVMTGFRVAWGGVQTMLQLSPDITTLGKVIGGGMPLAAYGGRADIMDQIAPAGPVYQAGTLSGNPVAVAAGLKTLELLDMPSVYSKLGDMSQRLMSGFQNLAQDFGLPMQTDFEGGMFGFFFRSRPVHNYDDAKGCDIELFKKFFHQMLNAGIYLAPSAFEAGFLSLAHTEQDIQQTLAMARQSMESLTSNDS